MGNPANGTAVRPGRTPTPLLAGNLSRSQKTPQDRSTPWEQPATVPRRVDRSTSNNLKDASWVPFSKGVFADKGIYRFNQGLTMHNTLDCVPDTAVRALMMKDRSNWGYNTYAELKARTKKFRALGNCSGAETPTDPVTEGITKLFFNHRIGIIFVQSTRGGNDAVRLLEYIPAYGQPRVEHYFLWSMENNASRRAIGYSDALAKRVGKDCFKLLLTKKEMTAFHEECYPDPSPRQKLQKKHIMWGSEMPNDMKVKICAAGA